MHFDWTVNLGNVVAVLVLLVGFVTAHRQNIKELQDIKTKVGLMYSWFQHSVINRKDE